MVEEKLRKEIGCLAALKLTGCTVLCMILAFVATRSTEAAPALSAADYDRIFALSDSLVMISQYDHLLADTLLAISNQIIRDVRADYELLLDIHSYNQQEEPVDNVELAGIRQQLRERWGLSKWEGGTPDTLLNHLSSKLAESAALLKQAHEHNPFETGVVTLLVTNYTMLSRVLRSAQVIREAREVYELAIIEDPDSYPAHFELGMLLKDAGEDSLALLHFRNAEFSFLFSGNRLRVAEEWQDAVSSFLGIPLVDTAIPEAQNMREYYATILLRQADSELVLGQASNAQYSYARSSRFLSEENRERLQQRTTALKWHGTPESQQYYLQAQDAEASEDYPLAREYYLKALTGVTGTDEMRKINHDLGFLLFEKLQNQNESARYLRAMIDEEFPLPDEGGVPADTTIRNMLYNYGYVHQTLAKQLNLARNPRGALEVFQAAAEVPNPFQGEALLASAGIMRQGKPRESLELLHQLEMMLDNDHWGVSSWNAEQKCRSTLEVYRLFYELYRKLNNWEMSDEYRQKASNWECP